MNVQFKTPKNSNRFFFGNPSQAASTTDYKEKVNEAMESEDAEASFMGMMSP